MIIKTGSLSRKVTVACSGGVDSMVVVDFLSRNHTVKLLTVDHGTQTSAEAIKFLASYCYDNSLEWKLKTINTKRPSNTSIEEHWRNERYKIFHKQKEPIITCHHLDDAVETWIWSSLHGEGKIIPTSNGNVIRPFLKTRKADFEDWALRHEVPFVEDQSNYDTKYMRNHIRHNMMKDVLKVNPGIHKVVRKKYE